VRRVLIAGITGRRGSYLAEFQPRVLEAVAQHLASGSVMLDVGAHIGFVSAIAARADRYESKRGAGL
jgi:hypothetical protein